MAENSSPTLLRGQRYLSITAPVPQVLSDRIRNFQRSHGADPHGIHSHITLLICKEPQNLKVLRKLDYLAHAQPAIALRFGDPASFLPQAQVTYLSIASGAEELEKLHMLCRQQVGESVSPFPYVPHLTLAMRLSPTALSESLEEFRTAGEETGSFVIDHLEVFRYDGKKWAPLHKVQLGPLSVS